MIHAGPPHVYTVSQKSVPPLTCYSLDIHDLITIIFAEVLPRSEKSDDALFSHLTYLVLQHYRATEETQKTNACFVRATQSNCCSVLDFLSPEPCRQKPQAERIDYNI